MPEYSAGSMRHEITIQTEARVADGGGGYAQTFTESFTVYAAMEDVSGKETYKQGVVLDTKMYEFVIRYRSDKAVTAANRIKYGSRTFNIRTVNNTGERDKYLVIRAEENVAN
jgi:SPP1 family predicted phage head-tail adaptor